eukprot:TRINITY_DN1962_c0_g1_i2.p1 TRINITY_DN1962_c0_g1~~TRINITY_DN1962_c0_g1_i2.p1  ORF type:complete len:788 (-),score=204.67 TRINITY_DN1962_c0_g1_i2:764-3127(-)
MQKPPSSSNRWLPPVQGGRFISAERQSHGQLAQPSDWQDFSTGQRWQQENMQQAAQPNRLDEQQQQQLQQEESEGGNRKRRSEGRQYRELLEYQQHQQQQQQEQQQQQLQAQVPPVALQQPQMLQTAQQLPQAVTQPIPAAPSATQANQRGPFVGPSGHAGFAAPGQVTPVAPVAQQAAPAGPTQLDGEADRLAPPATSQFLAAPGGPAGAPDQQQAAAARGTQVVKEEPKPAVAVVKEDSNFFLPLPVAVINQAHMTFDEWRAAYESGYTPESKWLAYAPVVTQLQKSGILHTEEGADRFFRAITELAVSHCLVSENAAAMMSYYAIDLYSKLVVFLAKYYEDPSNPTFTKLIVLNKVLYVTTRVIRREADDRRASFNPKPYFRLLVAWLVDFTSPDPVFDPLQYQVLMAFCSVFSALQPTHVPSFSFVWLELVSHRACMPKLLVASGHKGWPILQRLLVALFKFLEPYLRNAELLAPVRLLYSGTLRVLLVLLHDFPEFLCDHHFDFCNAIPPSCIQMRNLILSAFPRNMRLPDPFTPNLKVDLLPEIGEPPRILSDVDAALRKANIKGEIDEYLKNRQPRSFLTQELKMHLLLPATDVVSHATLYNVPLINSLVLYVGMQAIPLQQGATPSQLSAPSAPVGDTPPMDIFERLITDLDTEGRYLFVNAIANQLRYPNNHTHYFSCVLLMLFQEAKEEIVQEQITRVLLERLIVNRPHPWGLLITFIELIKNPRYHFWSHSFTKCAPEIEKLFQSVARSCMGGAAIGPDGDDGGGLLAGADQNLAV